MKKFKILDKLKKVILIILCAITVFFSMPVKSEAGIGEDIVDFILKLPDAVMSTLNKHVSERGGSAKIKLNLKGWGGVGYIYNFEVTPYDIFTSGLEYYLTVDYDGTKADEPITKLPILDINFFEEKEDNVTSHGESINSSIILRPVISSVYKSLRNLVLIVMLVILLYVGIRIVIASAVADQVKYKQWIMDWVVGICLVVILQYIMSFLMNVNEIIVEMLGDNKEASYYISISSLGTGTSGGYSSWGNVQDDAQPGTKKGILYLEHLDVCNGDWFDYNSNTGMISGIERSDWDDEVFVNARILNSDEGSTTDKALYRCDTIEYVRTITTFGSDYTTEYKPSGSSDTFKSNDGDESATNENEEKRSCISWTRILWICNIICFISSRNNNVFIYIYKKSI